MIIEKECIVMTIILILNGLVRWLTICMSSESCSSVGKRFNRSGAYRDTQCRGGGRAMNIGHICVIFKAKSKGSGSVIVLNPKSREGVTLHALPPRYAPAIGLDSVV